MNTDKYMTVDTTIENVRKIERKRKHKRGYFGKSRERNVCPICNSLDVAKRSTTFDYKCYNCKWIGKGVKKTMI